MRHKRIHDKALFLDEFIQRYSRTWKRKYFPHRMVTLMVRLLFPDAKFIGKGVLKTAHYVSTRTRTLALKVSSEKHIEGDMFVYTTVPRYARARYFAKIYWSTRHCLLQRYGRPAEVTRAEANALKKRVNRHLEDTPYRITDLKKSNICVIGGRLKIIDANLIDRATSKKILG